MAVISLYLGVMLIFSLMFRIFERPFFNARGLPTYDSFPVAVYTVWIKDQRPGTVVGQFILIASYSVGIMLLSMFYVVCENKFKLSQNEKKAFHNIRITRNAASTITNAFRYASSTI